MLITGAALTVAGTAVGLRRLEYDRIARVGLLSSAFFVASLIHVPLGPSSVHLILNGLVGLMLGWAAVPAILVALALQAVLFQFGGLTTLGVNTTIMALPAVAGYHLFQPMLRKGRRLFMVTGFACGFGAVAGAGIIAALALALSGEGFVAVAWILLAAHLPVMIIEGLVTAFCLAFLAKVQPDLLPGHPNDRARKDNPSTP